jgi:hypothetical protein
MPSCSKEGSMKGHLCTVILGVVDVVEMGPIQRLESN